MARARVLVVDDEPEVLRLVAGVLERAEYEVAPAPGPKQALEIIATAGPFDLVVSDVVMPGMCGPELANEIRARSPSSAIMFISGCVPVGQLPNGIPYLGKPFTARDLLGAVARVLGATELKSGAG
ncbi:MAG: response regulator [Bryobacteraceae bacterium]